MKRALSLPILLAGLGLGLVDCETVGQAERADAPAQVQSQPTPAFVPSPDTHESSEVDSCTVEPPVLAQYDPGPVELPAPVVVAPTRRAFAQCTENPVAADAT